MIAFLIGAEEAAREYGSRHGIGVANNPIDAWGQLAQTNPAGCLMIGSIHD